MKQTITPNQLNELSEKGKEKLKEWWKPRFGDIWTLEENLPNGSSYFINDLTAKHGLKMIQQNETQLPLLSIGQMIEFLDENDDSFIIEKDDGYYVSFDTNPETEQHQKLFKEKELCDVIWEAVKEVLEK